MYTITFTSLVPRLHLPNKRKMGGEPGTSWHVTDIKLRQVDKTAHWHSRCENTDARLTTCTTWRILWKRRQIQSLPASCKFQDAAGML